MKWDGTIGPASIISMIGALSVLVTLGIVWGTTTAKIDAAALKAEQVHQTTLELAKGGQVRDHRVSDQAERLGKIETSVQFIIPALQRIESKLDATK